MENGGGMARVKRAEIDTRKPFRSVKEAVTLFGDKVLAGELNATKLKQLQAGGGGRETGHGYLKRGGNNGNVSAELEETKQSLEKAKEESLEMAHCLSSLQEELEQTKKELQLLKERDQSSQRVRQMMMMNMESEIDDDVKVVEADSSMEYQIKLQAALSHHDSTNVEDGSFEFQKKRYVTFANPPAAMAMAMAHKVAVPMQGVEKLERVSSFRKEKNKIKKTFIPLITAIFNKKKGNPTPAAA